MPDSYRCQAWMKLGAESAGPAEPIARLGLALQSSLSPSAVIGRLSDTLSEMLRLERCVVVEGSEPSDPLYPLLREAFARKEVVHALGPRSLLCAPLFTEQHPEGAIVAERPAVEPFVGPEMALLAAVAPIAAGALRRARVYDRATTDSLTGLPNRQRFVVELEDAVLSGGPLSLAVLDLDHFKHKNEVYGRPVCDRVLTELAELLQGRLPQASCVARTDEDEFAAILPGAGLGTSRGVAEELRRAAGDRVFDEAHEGIHVTLSAGIGELKPGEMASSLYSRSSDALAAAKRGGRNRVEGAP